MEFLNMNVGWRTILLVQFQPQYISVLLIGIYVSCYVVMNDVADSYRQSLISDKESYSISQHELLIAFDIIYFIDVFTTVVYKLSSWEEAKQVYAPRPWWFIILEFISCVPVCHIMRIAEGKFTLLAIYMRFRVLLRIMRIIHFFFRIRKHVGHPPFQNVVLEFFCLITLYLMIVNLMVVILMTKELYYVKSYFMLMYNTIAKVTGKGAPDSGSMPHKLLLPLLFCTFLNYMMYIIYVAFFIVALMHNMSDQFIFVNSMTKIMGAVQKWKYHSVQMYNTVQMFYTETWRKRGCLTRYDTFDYIIPGIMSKELKLDVCWDAFKHSHVFRNMEVHYLRYLSTLTTLTFLTPGELLFKKGKFKSRMVYIISGVIQLLSQEDGETPILSFSGGTCLGETTLFVDQPSSCTVMCKSFAEVVIFERKNFFKSYDLYPNEFTHLLHVVFRRYSEAKHFVKINRYQIKNAICDAKSQVLTMKWLKRTLRNIANEDETSSKTIHIATVNLDDRMYESSFEKMIFSVRYLDLMVMADEYQLSCDIVMLKYTCPIIFQPNSGILSWWNKIVAFFSLILLFSYIHYACTTKTLMSEYTLFVYFLTFLWNLDLYIQCSTAIVTRDNVVTEISKIVIHHLSRPLFFLDICSAFPLELVCFIMMGDLTPRVYHIVKANRILKCYRVLSLFDISTTQSSTWIVAIKYIKLLLGILAVCTNLAGVIYLNMCPKEGECSYAFETFLDKKKTKLSSTYKVVLICHFLSLQFMGGLVFGPFPADSCTAFVIAQMVYYLTDMCMLADVAAAETLRNKNTLKYHEFVSNVNIVMKQWEFNREFRKRVLKYCVVQWDYDNGAYLLYQEKLYEHVPFDLFKIGQHISFARSLAHVPLFQELTDEVIAWICVHMERSVIPPGEVITYSGEVCKEMYVIEAGYCHMIAQSRTTAKILGPGDSFSVLETCLNVSTINTVITLSHCRILSLSYENYLKTMRYFPHILSEINTILKTSIDWVGFEQLMNKEFLDIESYTPDVPSFNVYGYSLDKDSSEYDEFHSPFDNFYVLKIFKYILLRMTIKPHGQFIKYWEWGRCVFASFTCILSPITLVIRDWANFGFYFRISLDITAWIDIYLRHHVAYFNEIGIEIKHPLMCAEFYWKHGFLMDLVAVFPFDVVIPLIFGIDGSAKTLAFLRLPRIIQGVRIYNMFNYYIKTTGYKTWIICKYFTMVVYFQLFSSFIIIHTKCEFDEYTARDDTFSFGVKCIADSWITPKKSFQLPLTPVRVYAYGVYFMAKISTFKGLEGFEVVRYSECVEIVIIVIIWLCLFPYFNSKLIASVMYRNVDLVVYQNAMSALVKFMRFRKIDPVLKNEVIDHFEYIWHKKKGRNESELFKAFNIALHEDALYHIYGKVIQESSIFKGASKSFFKSLLLNVKHEIFLKRGIISRVNNVHGTVYLLFKGQVQVLGPDYNKLLTLSTGSIFGHLDNIETGRQTLTFIARGHVELLTIKSKNFHSILSKYRGIRTHFKSLTAINVDYLINQNKVETPEHILEETERKHTVHIQEVPQNKDSKKKGKKRIRKYTLRKMAGCVKCCRGCRNCFFKSFGKVYVRGTVLKIWEAIVLGGVCFIGSIFEFYQKSSNDMSDAIIAVLYTADVLFCIKIYLEFHTSYDDDRGLAVTVRKLIAKKYLQKMLGFRVDLLSTIPFEVVCFFFSGETKKLIFTYGRILRLLRIIMVVEFFHNVNQKLNINVLVMRFIYLMVWVILMTQFLVFFLFFCARFDRTMEMFGAHLIKFYRINMYLRQVRVILHMFTGSQIESYKPNNCALILMTSMMMIFTRFIIAIFIAETCATLETVMHNKSGYETKILRLKKITKRAAVSIPLYNRMWQYVTLLWIHHKGEQFPYLLSQAPYYLREGVLDSMFGFHLRSHPIMKKCHMDLIRQMAACMTTMVFFPGDFVTFVGDIDECMYFVHKGEICALSEDSLNNETIDTRYKAGQMFGMEQGLYKRCGHEFTYRADCYSIIIVLNRKDWIHLLDYFPASKYLIFDKEFEKNLLKKHDVTKARNLGKPKLPETYDKKKKTYQSHMHRVPNKQNKA